jgi:hypothetical protein
VKDTFSTPVFMTPRTVTLLQQLKQIVVPYSFAYSRTTNYETAVVDIATRYVLDGPGSNPGYEAHTASCTMGTRYSLGVKQSERVADPLSYSTEVANGKEVYLCVAAVRAYALHGVTFTFYYITNLSDKASFKLVIVTRASLYELTFLYILQRPKI